MADNKLLTNKGKETLYKKIVDFIDARIDFKSGKLSQEEMKKTEEDFKLVINDLEWRLE